MARGSGRCQDTLGLDDIPSEKHSPHRNQQPHLELPSGPGGARPHGSRKLPCSEPHGRAPPEV